MEKQLPFQINQHPIHSPLTAGRHSGNSASYLLTRLIILIVFFASQVNAQGTWTALTSKAPTKGGGGMVLLSDGSVLAKAFAGGSDSYGNLYNKLTPDIHGSYVNGTWSTIAPMHSTRLYYSTQVLMDGRVYVAGGEYGTGNSKGETYDPLTNIWTAAPNPGKTISDANSEILPDGRVLQALVTGNLKGIDYYDPVTNTYSTAPSAFGKHNESAWVKFPDNSILFVDRGANTSERYIPSLHKWVHDALVPVALYDPYGLECGAGLLLPDGRAFFLGSLGHTAFYTPSGDTLPGTWAAGPDLPGGKGTPDAPAAMMVNGKILCAVSPAASASNVFPSPTSFYEFDYLTSTFTQIGAPGGGLTRDLPCYVSNMVDLPNGQVLFGYQDSTQYYVYTPDGTPLSSGKPTITGFSEANCDGNFTIYGTLFNGISEGAAYGDDWQMASNYPIVRLTSGSKVYYARTSNWNSTGVAQGSAPDTAQFTLPAGLPVGNYSLVVIANGIASNPVSVSPLLKATITPGGSLDICTTGSVVLYANGGTNYTYQWMKGTVNLPGATNQSFIATSVGSYRVTVTNAFGCSKTSALTKVVSSCKMDQQTELSAASLSLYPNPNSGQFAIDFSIGDASLSDEATVEITNTVGQQIFEEKIPMVNGQLHQEISLSNHPAGLLYLKIRVSGKEFIQQITISE